VFASEEITDMNIALYSTYSILHFIDYGQTLNIAKNPDKYYEMNPLLGKYPTVDKVNLYFISTYIINSAIIYILPNEYKNIWMTGIIGVEVLCVGKNINSGIKINF
jgi:hypothetical protein